MVGSAYVPLRETGGKGEQESDSLAYVLCQFARVCEELTREEAREGALNGRVARGRGRGEVLPERAAMAPPPLAVPHAREVEALPSPRDPRAREHTAPVSQGQSWWNSQVVERGGCAIRGDRGALLEEIDDRARATQHDDGLPEGGDIHDVPWRAMHSIRTWSAYSHVGAYRNFRGESGWPPIDLVCARRKGSR